MIRAPVSETGRTPLDEQVRLSVHGLPDTAPGWGRRCIALAGGVLKKCVCRQSHPGSYHRVGVCLIPGQHGPYPLARGYHRVVWPSCPAKVGGPRPIALSSMRVPMRLLIRAPNKIAGRADKRLARPACLWDRLARCCHPPAQCGSTFAWVTLPGSPHTSAGAHVFFGLVSVLPQSSTVQDRTNQLTSFLLPIPRRRACVSS